MSWQESSRTDTAVSDPGLTFLIVGASVAGLAAAITLKESGHDVLVLEKDTQLGGAGSGFNACARVPPNGSKILLEWGLGEETRSKSSLDLGFYLYKYFVEDDAPPDFIGINRWNEEWLSEARGGYMYFQHLDFLRLLYKKLNPVEDGGSNGHHGPRATVLFGAEVVEINADICSVTLKSGSVHTGDAILGADGARGIVRRMLMLEEETEPDWGERTGLAMYSAVIPREVVIQHELDDVFYNQLGATVWMGSNRASIVNVAGGNGDIVLLLYTSDSVQDGSWSEEAEVNIMDVLGPCDPRLKKLASLAGRATCVQITRPSSLESWVSASGRVLAIGDAAHPLPAGGLHCYSIALEDGAFIGRIFAHSRDRDRVPELFCAFQEQRERRCSRIRAIEEHYIMMTTLPDGETQAARDAGIRANYAAGRNGLDGDLQQMQDDFRLVFGYDAIDDADEWWISWGRFRAQNTFSAQKVAPNTPLVQSAFEVSVSGAGYVDMEKERAEGVARL